MVTKLTGFAVIMIIVMLLFIIPFLNDRPQGTWDQQLGKRERKLEKIDNSNDKEKEKAIITVNSPELIDVVVNKERKLPEGYIPSDLVIPNVKFSFVGREEKSYMRKDAAVALEKLFYFAKQEGIQLFAVSGYRSEKRQKMIYENNLKEKGQQHTDKYSAKSGHSEHQTGLVMDVSAKSVNNTLETTFADTKEGKWLEENAHRAG
ncbi:M15 family metallopeptidase, partial [Bacillus cereus]|nr:M15 family metallopeptidase [Bacillus cereus]